MREMWEALEGRVVVEFIMRQAEQEQPGKGMLVDMAQATIPFGLEEAEEVLLLMGRMVLLDQLAQMAVAVLPTVFPDHHKDMQEVAVAA